MSRIGTIGVALSLTLLLAACQGPPVPPEDDGSCVPATAGKASDSIAVTGERGAVPQVEFGEFGPVYTTQRTIVRTGTGRMADRGALATFSYAVYDGSTGELIDDDGFDGHHAQATLDDSTLISGLRKAMLCSTQGSRVVAVVPPEDAFGTEGLAAYGVSGSEPLVIVVDLNAVAADRADGKQQKVDDERLPQVTVGATGEPRLLIPPVIPPAQPVTRLLKQGDGELVTEGATVTVEYIGVEWKSSRTFDSSWRRAELVRRPTTGFITGFGSALVGATVGSQLLVVLPPGQGYDEAGNTQFGLDRGDTLVFVIDVLATVPPPEAALPPGTGE